MTKRLALAFTTKDRVHLSERVIDPLLHPDIDLLVVDGSATEAGRAFAGGCVKNAHVRINVHGGADSAIVYALTTLLDETEAPYVGLVENDCFLHPDWLGPTLALFERGAADGLCVGAVSARSFTDRVLCQRDGYALMHNLGAGHIIFTREAARLTLNHYRSHWTTATAKVFHRLCGLDIRKWWCFAGSQQPTTVDWGFDAILAAHGLASLALTPSLVTMIGQDPQIADRLPVMADKPVELLRDDKAFTRFALQTARIRAGTLRLPDQQFIRLDDGSSVIFPHQLGAIDANEHGDWRFKWHQGFGPFAYVADPQPEQTLPTLEVPIVGPCAFMVSGGQTGGRVRLTDTQSGYEIETDLPPETDDQRAANLAVPGGIAYRTVCLTEITPGCVFYGIQVGEPQVTDPTWTFDHSVLPKTA